MCGHETDGAGVTGPTGGEAYAMVRDELGDPRTSLSDLDADIVALAREYAARRHQKWPPRPARAEEGWTFRIIG